MNKEFTLKQLESVISTLSADRDKLLAQIEQTQEQSADKILKAKQQEDRYAT
jgi:hypothetical protein